MYIEIGERIKESRQLQGMSQDELADKAGLARSSITNIEKARQRPNLEVLQKISEALNEDLRYIIFGKLEAENLYREFWRNKYKRLQDKHTRMTEKVKEALKEGGNYNESEMV